MRVKGMIMLVVSLMVFLSWNYVIGYSKKELKPLLSFGSKGIYVEEVQSRLKYLGYFPHHVPVTGYYGKITTQSVQWFQKKFQLKVIDGAVGPATWDMLRKVTKKYVTKKQSVPDIPKASQGVSANNLNLLARAVYSEARGEPYPGQVAIAAVILNRVKDSKFPNTIPGVIFQSNAFSAVNDGQFWGLSPDITAKKAVQDALNGWDPSNGAIYYFNPSTATNKWIWSRPLIKMIGKHRFCK